MRTSDKTGTPMTMFWIITAGLTLLAVIALSLAQWRARPEEDRAAEYDIDVYRDQLKEVERDVARGVLEADEAERLRTEIARRILAADAAGQAEDESRQGASWPVVIGCAVFLIGGSFALYGGIGGLTGLGAPGYGDLALADRIAQADERRASRPSQAEAEAGQPLRPAPQVEEGYPALVADLRAAVAERPTDIQGHALLARAEARLGDFTAAHRLQSRLITLKGPQATVQDYADLADLLVLAAGGYVSPETETVLATILNEEPANAVARYYFGLMLAQTGRPDNAFRIWDTLLREGPADAPWIAPIQAEIGTLAALAGVQYQMPAIGTGRGPTQADIDATADLSPSERMEMIEGMVSTLADRLRTEGGPVEDWAQLITSLGVLGRTNDATMVFEGGMEVFAGDGVAIDILNRAADRAGLQ